MTSGGRREGDCCALITHTHMAMYAPAGCVRARETTGLKARDLDEIGETRKHTPSLPLQTPSGLLVTTSMSKAQVIVISGDRPLI